MCITFVRNIGKIEKLSSRRIIYEKDVKGAIAPRQELVLKRTNDDFHLPVCLWNNSGSCAQNTKITISKFDVKIALRLDNFLQL